MHLKEKIEKLCKGRAIRIFSAPKGPSVTFVESYRNCGKSTCTRCREKSNRPHGPYWNLNYVDDHGRMKTLYVGRNLPDVAFKDAKVSFADVVRYRTENEESKASITKYRQEIYRMKREMEGLYEELRIQRKSSKRRSSPAADKLFKQLVLKYHPDHNAAKVFAADDVMKDINQLYHRLLNP